MIDLLHLLVLETIVCGASSNLSVHQRAAIPGAHFARAAVGQWVRYEREHSMTAGHIDWHEDERTGMKVCVILDDASWTILAGGEFCAINTENSILVVDQIVWNYW